MTTADDSVADPILVLAVEPAASPGRHPGAHHAGSGAPAGDPDRQVPDTQNLLNQGRLAHRGGARGPAHDAHHHHRRHRPVGGFHDGTVRHHPRRGLAELASAARSGDRRGAAHRGPYADWSMDCSSLASGSRRSSPRWRRSPSIEGSQKASARPGRCEAIRTGSSTWARRDFLGAATGIPNQLFLVVVSTVLIGTILARTPFGRSLYAIGNNETGCPLLAASR